MFYLKYRPKTIEEIDNLRVKEMIAKREKEQIDLLFLTIHKDDPTGLGRIVRSKNGKVLKIVEEKSASKEEKAIKEINTGLYCFNRKFLDKYAHFIKKNKEIVEVGEGDKCPACEKGKIKKERSIEVGNIFPLKTRFTDAFDFKVMGADGKMKDILMGCYGIGPSRVMGSIVEIHNDKDGIIWPKEVAPFDIHLVEISGKNEGIRDAALSLYDELVHNGIEVLYDDRDVRPGEKFADADLIGIPLRLVVSERSMGEGGVEWKLRNEKDNRIVKMDEIHDVMEEYVKK